MAKIPAQDAYNALIQTIKNNGGVYSHWYCGITNDLVRRIRLEHKVPNNGLSFFCECLNKPDAESVEKAILNAGCMGGTGGGALNSEYVYIYKMTPDTVQ